MELFSNEIDNRIKELQELDEYKYRKGKVSNKKIAETINEEFGTEYTKEQIRSHRTHLDGYFNPIDGYFTTEKGREALKKYSQSEKGKETRKKARKRTDSKIATKIYNNLVELAKTKYGREVLGLNQKETRAYLKKNQLTIDHISPIEMDYIEQLCMVNGYRWNAWSDVPEQIKTMLKGMFNQIDNLQLIPMSENLAKRNMTKRTAHY